MKAEYNNEFGEWEDCTLLAEGIGKNAHMCMIEIDGIRGWCSIHLVEIEGV